MSTKHGATVKGYIKNRTSSEIMEFQFNPEEFQHTRGATYSELVAPGMSYPVTQYVHGNSRVFSVVLFLLDRPYSGIINKQIEFLNKFLPKEENKVTYKMPSDMLFCFGNFIKICVLEEFDVHIIEWDSKGHPVQAELTLSLRQVGDS